MSRTSKQYFDEWQAELANAETRGSTMDMNNVFPSKYLKASDLQGHKIKLVISSITMEKLGDDEKPCMFFEGKDKGVILNKTKAGILSSSFSPESDGWIGKEIFLYPTKVNFQGQMVDSIGIEIVMSEAEADNAVPF